MKYILTIAGTHISSRFDMTSEILIATSRAETLVKPPQTILLNRTSSEDMCELIIKEETGILICGGIEERYYKYLQWKKTKVIESVIGPYKKVLQLVLESRLTPGQIVD